MPTDRRKHAKQAEQPARTTADRPPIQTQDHDQAQAQSQATTATPTPMPSVDAPPPPAEAATLEEPPGEFLPLPGTELTIPLSALIGYKGRPEPSPRLRKELEQIRESAQKAEEVGASIRLY